MKTIFFIFLFILTVPQLYSQSKSLPYSSGFDSAVEKEGWQEYRLGFIGPYSWTYNDFDYCVAPSSLYHGYNVSGNGTDTIKDWFVSPPINFNQPTKMTFEVSPSMFGTKIQIWVGTNTSDPSEGGFVKVVNMDLPYVSWNECLDTAISIDVTDDSAYVAFRYVGSNYNSYSVDNISITAVSPSSSMEFGEGLGNTVIYPNPIPQGTEIKLQHLPNELPYEIKLYDLLGNEVWVDFSVREKEIVLNTTELNSGLYFLKLKSKSSFVSIHKILVE